MYIEITFKKLTANTKDLLIASLPCAEGFEEASNSDLKAIFLKDTYNETEVISIAETLNVVLKKLKSGSKTGILCGNPISAL